MDPVHQGHVPSGPDVDSFSPGGKGNGGSDDGNDGHHHHSCEMLSSSNGDDNDLAEGGRPISSRASSRVSVAVPSELSSDLSAVSSTGSTDETSPAVIIQVDGNNSHDNGSSVGGSSAPSKVSSEVSATASTRGNNSYIIQVNGNNSNGIVSSKSGSLNPSQFSGASVASGSTTESDDGPPPTLIVKVMAWFESLKPIWKIVGGVGVLCGIAGAIVGILAAFGIIPEDDFKAVGEACSGHDECQSNLCRESPDQEGIHVCTCSSSKGIFCPHGHDCYNFFQCVQRPSARPSNQPSGEPSSSPTFSSEPSLWALTSAPITSWPTRPPTLHPSQNPSEIHQSDGEHPAPSSGATTAPPSPAPTDMSKLNMIGKLGVEKPLSDRFGSSVAMTGDGRTLLVGAPNLFDATEYGGYVDVYQLIGTEWRSIDVLEPVAFAQPGVLFGFTVSVSDDGTEVLVTSNLGGRIDHFQWDGDHYRRVGAVVTNAAARSGIVSGNGLILAYNLQSHRSGKVLIREMDPESSYPQIDTAFTGNSTSSFYGSAIALSADGETVAIGSMQEREDGSIIPPFLRGFVDVIHQGARYQSISSTENIPDNVINNSFGSKALAVATVDGVVVIAVGHSEGNSGRGRVTIFKGGHTGSWITRGPPIIGKSGEGIGSSIALSRDASILVVGMDGDCNGRYGARVFEYDGSEYIPLPHKKESEVGDFCPNACALASSERTLACGDGNGIVHIYKF